MLLDLVANVIYLSAVTVSEVNLMTTQDVPPQEIHAVVPVEFRAVSFIWSDVYPCRFTGIAVPVERDWEEVVENGYVKTVIPPEPGKLYTYGIIVNKKSCPGKPDEAMFSTGSWTGAFKNLGLPKGIKLMAYGLSKDVALQPKWLPQAMKVIEEASSSNEAAKNFVAYTSQTVSYKAKPTPTVDQQVTQ